MAAGTALGLEEASRIVDEALRRGRELGLQPLAVAVLDAGGHLKAFKREDGASILRPQIAEGKAWSVLGMGLGGRELARRAAANPQFMGALSDASGGRMIPVPGGVLIRSSDGGILGAVGISGDLSEKDEDCAVHGIRAVGLRPDTGDKA
jgi:uncharacterized protein GlcG (DUF336 family)